MSYIMDAMQLIPFVKRGAFGIIRLSKEEIDDTISYLQKRRQGEENTSLLEKQLEQSKYILLQDLSVDELDFLLENGIDLNAFKWIILAKGGLARGLATIRWNANLRKYQEIKIKWKIIAVVLMVMALIYGFLFFMGPPLFAPHTRRAYIIFSILGTAPAVYPGTVTSTAREKRKEIDPSIFGM